MEKYVVCTENEDGDEVFWAGRVSKAGVPSTAKTVKGARKFTTAREANDAAGEHTCLLDWRTRKVLYEDRETNPWKLWLHGVRQRMPEKTSVAEDGKKEYSSRPYRIADEAISVSERALESCAGLLKKLEEDGVIDSKEAKKLTKKFLS